MIYKPLLAAKKLDFKNIKFPVMATPKIDGIRCLKINGKALSRSFKQIPNKYIRTKIESFLPDGIDGEIICGQNFNDTQSIVMTEDKECIFTYVIFDYVKDSLLKLYIDRINDFSLINQTDFIQFLYPIKINNLEELDIIIDKHLIEGYEGTMIRDPNSPYKCGRSTLKEAYLIAIKSFEDGEAEVIGFEELYHNQNEKTEDNFGKTKRSSKKDKMLPANTLGSFIVKSIKDDTEFKIGTGKGLTTEIRQEIWNNREKYLGKLIHYRYQAHGSKNKPRIPIWYGFRSLDDINE